MKIVNLDFFTNENGWFQQERVFYSRVGFTNGCFDILHAGHAHYLVEASRLCDILIVGINSDDSVKKLKGNNRPYNTQYNRAFLLSMFNVINYITIFDEEMPLEIIKQIKPDIIFKGGDYKEEDVVGFGLAEVKILSLIPDLSTTKTIEKLC